MADAGAELRTLKNIGPSSVEKLQGIGIQSRRQIETLGAVAVYRLLRERYPVSLNMLWALQGALLDLPFNHLPSGIREALLAELSDEPA